MSSNRRKAVVITDPDSPAGQAARSAAMVHDFAEQRTQERRTGDRNAEVVGYDIIYEDMHKANHMKNMVPRSLEGGRRRTRRAKKTKKAKKAKTSRRK